MQITSLTSPKKISDYVAKLREQKGKESKTLTVIDNALIGANDFVINLFWEKALTYQHLVMDEDAKGDSADLAARKKNLLMMEETVKLAKYFIVRFDLYHWNHRLYRFLGRVSDYKKEYQRAIGYYRKSLKYAKTDPEYIGQKFPRWLEVEAFLSYSLLMLGQVSKGHTSAKKLYQKFDIDKDAINLKENDYLTWAIWKSGIPIRTINALIDKKIVFDKKDASIWIDEAQKILIPRNKFEYRLDEIKNLKKRLSKN